MDKKKTLTSILLSVGLSVTITSAASDRQLNKVEFCGSSYGEDSITLFLNAFDQTGKRIENVSLSDLENQLTIKEDGNEIELGRGNFDRVGEGQRIPSNYTISVLVDLTIPERDKMGIYQAVSRLVDMSEDGSIYLSFFGDDVTSTELVTSSNINQKRSDFSRTASRKYFFSAIYSKLVEFSPQKGKQEDYIKAISGYMRQGEIARRAGANPGTNLLFVFTEGSQDPAVESDINYLEVKNYLEEADADVLPSIYGLYNTASGEVEDIVDLLSVICKPTNGNYMPAEDMDEALHMFQEVIDNKAYSVKYVYCATEDKQYMGSVHYTAFLGRKEVSSSTFSIGSAENPWPNKEGANYLLGVLIAFLVFAFFFVIMKIVIPFCRSKAFERKYYRQYVPRVNVTKRVCRYCRQEIMPGALVVERCEHTTHVSCWKQYGYKCAEYGQKCKVGIQPHVDMKSVFSARTFKDSIQTISGVAMGLVSWIIYELSGRGSMFNSLSDGMVQFCLSPEQYEMLSRVCIEKTSAFLSIGCLLGFLLSLAFRWNEEYRAKDVLTVLRILGMSLLSCIIGMVAFAVGAYLMCLLVSLTGSVAWYVSLPAYLLFSVCFTLSLTIQSTIPFKSAMIGGGIAAVIGFVVLYCSTFAGRNNMLLNFVIFGGGLGAALVTVRMVAEKYFLVIQGTNKRIAIHKWMNAMGGGNKIKIGMTRECEIQMTWDKSNKVAKEHAQLYLDPERRLPVLKPLDMGVLLNSRVDLPVNKEVILADGDTFKLGDTVFLYTEKME